MNTGAVLTHDGRRWTGKHPGPGSAQQAHFFTTAFGTGPDDVWGTNGAGVFHWDGATWTSVPLALDLNRGWSLSPTDAFVESGYSNPGKLWRWDGRAWNPVAIDLRGARMRDFWGSGPDDVWAVGWRDLEDASGGEGVAWHWDGSTWTEVYRQPGQFLNRVFGTGRGDVWAIDFRPGDSTTAYATTAYALRWNGHTFERSGEFHDTHSLEHIAGTGPEDVWVAAGMTADFRTRMYHFDGRTWTEREPLPARIHRLWATPGGATFAAEGSAVLYESRR